MRDLVFLDVLLPYFYLKGRLPGEWGPLHALSIYLDTLLGCRNN